MKQKYYVIFYESYSHGELNSSEILPYYFTSKELRDQYVFEVLIPGTAREGLNHEVRISSITGRITYEYEGDRRWFYVYELKEIELELVAYKFW